MHPPPPIYSLSPWVVLPQASGLSYQRRAMNAEIDHRGPTSYPTDTASWSPVSATACPYRSNGAGSPGQGGGPYKAPPGCHRRVRADSTCAPLPPRHQRKPTETAATTPARRYGAVSGRSSNAPASACTCRPSTSTDRSPSPPC